MNTATQPYPMARAGRATTSQAALHRSEYRIISILLLGATAIAAAYFVAAGRWYNATALMALTLLGLTFIAAKQRLPSVFTLLFVASASINAFGYVFDLWKRPLWFDEAVHAFTSFTIAAAIGWIALARTKMLANANSWRITLSVVGIGILLGIAWEIFEWIIGIIGSPADTVVDLVMDAIGALAAGLLCAWVGRENLEKQSEAGCDSHD